jgi:hypothetical protein
MNIRIIAILAIALITATGALTLHWQKIDAEANAFAKACNDRGGEARRWDGMLQCLGAERKSAVQDPTAAPVSTKGDSNG